MFPITRLWVSGFYLGRQLSSVSVPICTLLSHVPSKTMKLLHCEDLFPVIKITCCCDGLNDIPTLSRIFEYLAPVVGTVWGALGHVRSMSLWGAWVGFENLKIHAVSSSLSLLPACGSRNEPSASSSVTVPLLRHYGLWFIWKHKPNKPSLP